MEYWLIYVIIFVVGYVVALLLGGLVKKLLEIS